MQRRAGFDASSLRSLLQANIFMAREEKYIIHIEKMNKKNFRADRIFFTTRGTNFCQQRRNVTSYYRIYWIICRL